MSSVRPVTQLNSKTNRAKFHMLPCGGHMVTQQTKKNGKQDFNGIHSDTHCELEREQGVAAKFAQSVTHFQSSLLCLSFSYPPWQN